MSATSNSQMWISVEYFNTTIRFPSNKYDTIIKSIEYWERLYTGEEYEQEEDPKNPLYKNEDGTFNVGNLIVGITDMVDVLKNWDKYCDKIEHSKVFCVNMLFIFAYMLIRMGVGERYCVEINAIGRAECGGDMICDCVELFKEQFKNSTTPDGIYDIYKKLYYMKREMKDLIYEKNLPKGIKVEELKVCAVCSKPSKQKCKCGVKYCGTECQHSHWGEHKKTCPIKNKK